MFKILTNCVSGPPEGFEPYYGVDGYNGDGNVFRTENIKVQLAGMTIRIRDLEYSIRCLKKYLNFISMKYNKILYTIVI